MREIKHLTDEILGVKLAIEVGVEYLDGFSYITGGKYPHPDRDMSSLCQSLDAIAEVEKVVIEKTEGGAYVNALGEVVKIGGVVFPSAFAMATARQRAEACLLALSEHDETGK